MLMVIELSLQRRIRHAYAAALLKQEEVATSAAGALDADPSGSDATVE